MTRNVDVAIIGAGTAGLSARREVAKVTDNYVVIDDGPLGTTCARVGCMPSKVLIEVANRIVASNQLLEKGLARGATLAADREATMAHVRSLRDRFVRAVKQDMEEWTSTHLLRERAKFVGPGRLRAGKEEIVAKRVVIATGSSPIIPGPWRDYQNCLVDTDGFFELESLPETMAVIGTGVIGLELGQALARLGVQVTAITKDLSFGGLSDPEITDYVHRAIQKDMPILADGVSEMREEDGKLVISSGDQTVQVDRALVAIGRRPNLFGLDLAAAGIEVDQFGVPEFNPGTYRVPGHDVYIAGDVNSERPILHEAADEGRIVGYNAVRDHDQCFQRRTGLTVTFSDPNIAIVGQSYREIKETGRPFVEGKVSFEGQGRAIVKLKESGLLKVYADQESGLLLGAELFAPDGEHLAHLLAWSIANNMTVKQALAMPFYHPVLEEGVRTALRSAAGQVTGGIGESELLRCEDPPAESPQRLTEA